MLKPEARTVNDEVAAEQNGRMWLTDLATLFTIASAAALLLVASDMFERLTMIGGIIVCFTVWRFTRDSLVIIAMDLLVLGAVGGWGLRLYERIWWYDDMAHFVFSLLALMALARVVLHRFRAESLWLVLGALWLSWLGIGSLWELGEWISDQLAATYHSRGYLDTMMDMILNSLGSALGVAIYWRWFRTEADEAVVLKQ